MRPSFSLKTKRTQEANMTALRRMRFGALCEWIESVITDLQLRVFMFGVLSYLVLTLPVWMSLGAHCFSMPDVVPYFAASAAS